MRAAWAGQLDACRLLLGAGAQASLSDKNGEQALHAAAARGRSACAKLLLDHGADIEAKDAAGRSALLASAGAPFSDDEDLFFDCCRMLLDNGANLHARDASGASAIDLAIQANGHTRLSAMLESRELSLETLAAPGSSSPRL